MRPLVAHCHLGFGRLREQTGRPSEAEKHLAIAEKMYGEMEMSFWLQQTKIPRTGPIRVDRVVG